MIGAGTALADPRRGGLPLALTLALAEALALRVFKLRLGLPGPRVAAGLTDALAVAVGVEAGVLAGRALRPSVFRLARCPGRSLVNVETGPEPQRLCKRGSIKNGRQRCAVSTRCQG